jgi:hypothetical protein
VCKSHAILRALWVFHVGDNKRLRVPSRTECSCRLDNSVHFAPPQVLFPTGLNILFSSVNLGAVFDPVAGEVALLGFAVQVKPPQAIRAYDSQVKTDQSVIVN